MLVMGLMSGTSYDGTDAALARITMDQEGEITATELLHHCHMPHPRALRGAIKHGFAGSTEHLCRLNVQLGEAFATVAIKCAQGARMALSDIDAIASHGQTVYHIPPRGASQGATMQLGEPAVIAARTGVKVVSNFRAADMAAGGHGAPLVPYADYVLFGSRAPVAVQNIGGIANVTVVTKHLDNVFAFDTGPGNALLDEAARRLFNKPMDRAGRFATKGQPDMKLLKRLLAHQYFRTMPPKSTGRELFGTRMLEQILSTAKCGPHDLMVTLTHLTALSIADAYRRFVLNRVDIKEVILCGGGSRNPVLVGILADALSPIRMRTIDGLGIPSEAKEALSFAILGSRTLVGRHANVPGATGASRHVILGSITPAP